MKNKLNLKFNCLFRYFYFLILCLGALVPLSAMADSSPIVEKVVSEGSAAIINNNIASAKRRAVDAAIQNGFAEFINKAILSEHIKENENSLSSLIENNSKDYTQSYRILSEQADIDKGVFTVTLELSLFKTDLKKKIADMGLLFKGKEIKQILVILDEKDMIRDFDYTNFWANHSISEEGIKRYIIDKGFSGISRNEIVGKIDSTSVFQAVSGSHKIAADIAMRADAEVVIIGKSTVTLTRDSGDNKEFKAVISLKAIRADNAKVIASLEESETSSSSDPITGVRLALTNASEKLAGEVVDEILEGWKE